MKIAVLTQDNIPIETVPIPSALCRNWEVNAYVDKLMHRRHKSLIAAYMALHPTVESRHIGLDSLPTLASFILNLPNANIIDETLAMNWWKESEG